MNKEERELAALRKEYAFLEKQYPYRGGTRILPHPLLLETSERIQRLEHELRLQQFREEASAVPAVPVNEQDICSSPSPSLQSIERRAIHPAPLWDTLKIFRCLFDNREPPLPVGE